MLLACRGVRRISRNFSSSTTIRWTEGGVTPKKACMSASAGGGRVMRGGGEVEGGYWRRSSGRGGGGLGGAKWARSPWKGGGGGGDGGWGVRQPNDAGTGRPL